MTSSAATVAAVDRRPQLGSALLEHLAERMEGGLRASHLLQQLAHANRLSLRVPHQRRPQAPVADPRPLGEVNDVGQLDRLDLRRHEPSVGVGVGSRTRWCRRGGSQPEAFDRGRQLCRRGVSVAGTSDATPRRARLDLGVAERVQRFAHGLAGDGGGRLVEDGLGSGSYRVAPGERGGPELLGQVRTQEDRLARGIDLVREERRLLGPRRRLIGNATRGGTRRAPPTTSTSSEPPPAVRVVLGVGFGRGGGFLVGRSRWSWPRWSSWRARSWSSPGRWWWSSSASVVVVVTGGRVVVVIGARVVVVASEVEVLDPAAPASVVVVVGQADVRA